jgi:hypothetical protein
MQVSCSAAVAVYDFDPNRIRDLASIGLGYVFVATLIKCSLACRFFYASYVLGVFDWRRSA